MPDDAVTRELFHQIAWHDFVTWAFSEESIVRQFEMETGLKKRSRPRNGLDVMIDAATGYDRQDEKYASEFMLWVTRNIWGVEDAPEKVRRELQCR